MVDFGKLFDLDNERQPMGSRDWFVKPQVGDTLFYPVVAPILDAKGNPAIGAKAFEFFRDEESGGTKASYRYMLYVAVVAADDPSSKLPESVATHITPMAMGNKVSKDFEALVREGYTLTYLGDDGLPVVGTLFGIRREGTGLNTSYRLWVLPEPKKKEYPFPPKIEWPQDFILDVAARFTTEAKARHEEYKARAEEFGGGQPTQHPALVAGNNPPTDDGDIPF